MTAFLDLFTKDSRLPGELRNLPYDYNSVMHFGDREYSKNGHRTFLFKLRDAKQLRNGMSPTDLKKIEIVYGPECRKRDRMEKIDLCQNFPGVARRKRDVTSIPVRGLHSLRVNPNITPPQDKKDNDDHVSVANEKRDSALDDKDKNDAKDKSDSAKENDKKDVKDTAEASPHFRVENDTEDVGYADAVVKSLEIETEVEDLIEQVHRVAAAALEKAREKYCNKSKPGLRSAPTMEKPKNKNLLAIIDDTASYAKGLVEKAIANLTEFCETSKSIADYQRQACPFFDKSRCPKSYKSTKSGAVKHSTQHRPWIRPSTKHQGFVSKNIYENMLRLGNHSESQRSETTPLVPEKSEVEDRTDYPVSKSDLRMGTRIVFDKKSIYAPNQRRRRDVLAKETPDKPADSKTNVSERALDSNFTTRQVMVEVVTEEYRSETGDKNLGSATLGIKRRSQRFREDGDRNWSQPDRLDRSRDNDKGKGQMISDDDEPEFRKKKKRPTSSEEEKDRSRDSKKGRERNNKRQKDDEPDRWRGSSGRGSSGRGHESDTRGDLDKGRGRDREEDSDVGQGTDIKEGSERGRGKDTKGNNDRLNDKENDDDRHDRFSGKGGKGRSKNKKYASEEKRHVSDEEPEDSSKKIKTKASGRGSNGHNKDYKQESEENGRVSNEEPEEPPKKVKVKSKPSLQSGGSERKIPHTLKLSKRNREFYDERKWPDGLLRYVIKEGDFDIEDVRRRLGEVHDILKKRTCVKLEELTEEDSENYEDFLVLDNSPDYVTGRVGGKQQYGVYELLKGGQHRQHAAMMVMAALGFYFEVSRHDRDKYIRVHMRHVRPDKLHHFEKIRADATFPLPYDYKSATHPAWQFWRQIGRTGISTVATYKDSDPDGSIMKSLGQNEQLLSEQDILKINSVYGVECFRKSGLHDRNATED